MTNAYVLIGADEEVIGVHPTCRRAQKEAEKAEGRTLAWLSSDDPQYHRTSEDYRIAQVPAHMAPSPGPRRPLRLIP